MKSAILAIIAVATQAMSLEGQDKQVAAATTGSNSLAQASASAAKCWYRLTNAEKKAKDPKRFKKYMAKRAARVAAWRARAKKEREARQKKLRDHRAKVAAARKSRAKAQLTKAINNKFQGVNTKLDDLIRKVVALRGGKAIKDVEPVCAQELVTKVKTYDVGPIWRNSEASRKANAYADAFLPSSCRFNGQWWSKNGSSKAQYNCKVCPAPAPKPTIDPPRPEPKGPKPKPSVSPPPPAPKGPKPKPSGTGTGPRPPAPKGPKPKPKPSGCGKGSHKPVKASANGLFKTGLPSNVVTQLDKDIWAAQNKLRADPAYFIKYLEKEKKCFAPGSKINTCGKIRLRTQEGVPAIDEAISALKNQKALKPMKWEDGLFLSVRDHCRDQGSTGETGHSGSDGSSPGSRVDRYGKWHRTVGENISYGSASGDSIIMQLFVDDGVESRGHRHNLQKAAFGATGICTGKHSRYRTMSTLIYAGSYTLGAAGKAEIKKLGGTVV